MGCSLAISDKSFATSATRRALKLSTKNAWAKYARLRWPNNGVKGAMAEWDLTDGQARGLVYAQVSQATIDTILDHPNGGFGLGLEILCLRMQTSLEDYVAQAEQGAEDARLRAQADQEAARAMQSRLAGLRLVEFPPEPLGEGRGR